MVAVCKKKVPYTYRIGWQNISVFRFTSKIYLCIFFTRLDMYTKYILIVFFLLVTVEHHLQNVDDFSIYFQNNLFLKSVTGQRYWRNSRRRTSLQSTSLSSHSHFLSLLVPVTSIAWEVWLIVQRGEARKNKWQTCNKMHSFLFFFKKDKPK